MDAVGVQKGLHASKEGEKARRKNECVDIQGFLYVMKFLLELCSRHNF